MESRENLSVIRDDFGGQLALRVLQFLKLRNISECPYEENHCKQEQHRSGDDDPEPFDDFLSCNVCHFLSIL